MVYSISVKSSEEVETPSCSSFSVAGVQLVVPGDTVLAEPGFLKGKGLIQDGSGQLVATICGIVERVNKLLYIRPLKSRYSGEIGDVLVGRIVEVQGDRWLVDYGGSQLGSLPLGGITLPGNEQRRRVDEDKLQMRDFFKEGDLISAEVQKVQESGEVVLHMRSSRYSVLHNGQLVQLKDSSLVRRQASHIFTIQDLGLVLGNNGWVWIGAPNRVTGAIQSINFSETASGYRSVPSDQRQRVVRMREALLCLADENMEISSETLSMLLDLGNCSEASVKSLKERVLNT